MIWQIYQYTHTYCGITQYGKLCNQPRCSPVNYEKNVIDIYKKVLFDHKESRNNVTYKKISRTGDHNVNINKNKEKYCMFSIIN